jgi:hypothetical protein
MQQDKWDITQARQDAKKRMKQYRKEQGESDSYIPVIISIAVALLIADFVLRVVY